MNLLLQATLSGVLAGGLYALIAVGLALGLGAMRVLNLAHGQLVVLGACGAWVLSVRLGLDPLLAALAVAPLVFLLGALLGATVVERAARSPPQDQALATLGLGVALSGAVALGFPSGTPALPAALPARLDLAGAVAWRPLAQGLGGVVPAPLLQGFLAAVALAAALQLFLLRTDRGRAIRALAQDREAARLMGIRVRWLSVAAFGLGAALAGAAGALLAPAGPIGPGAGGAFTLKALAVAALGGTGSVAGAALGGLLIGLAESLAAACLPGSGELAVLALLLLALLAKPSGLLGRTRA